MNKKDYKIFNDSLYQLFYGEKTIENNWYTESDSGKKEWNQSKVALFWDTLRLEKMDRGDYNFSEFVFPVFLRNNFWHNDKNKVFTKKVEFQRANFKGRMSFWKVNFEAEAEFQGAYFSEKAYFKEVNFQGKVDFEKAEFHDEADFGYSDFIEQASFRKALFSKNTFFVKAKFLNSAFFTNAIFNERASFWKTTFLSNIFFEKSEFRKNTYFKQAKFQGRSDFQHATFLENINFESVEFFEKATFDRAIFEKSLSFKKASLQNGASFESTSFAKDSSFEKANFQGETSFKRTSFAEDIYFGETSFGDKTSFELTNFAEGINFKKANFLGETDFENANFIGRAYFNQVSFIGITTFKETNFKDSLFFQDFYCLNDASLIFFNTKFSNNQQSLFKNWHIAGNLIFEQVIFTEMVKFINCHFNQVQFLKADLTNTIISNCIFNRKKWNHRIIYNNERVNSEILKKLKEVKKKNLHEVLKVEVQHQKIKWGIDNKVFEKGYYQKELNEKVRKFEKEKRKKIDEEVGEIKNNDLKREHYEMMAETYRQLKTNQKNNNNWPLAGDAYRSEMVMRKKSLFFEFLTSPNKFWIFFSLLVMHLHDGFSGFQQSMLRPLIWLVVVWLGFAIGYYFYNTEALTNWHLLYVDLWECARLQSFYSLFPLSGKIENPLKPWKVLERILGVLLITFFGLATRARLKQ